MLHICEFYKPDSAELLEISISIFVNYFSRKFTSLPFFTEIWSFIANSRELNIFYRPVHLHRIFNSREH